MPRRRHQLSRCRIVGILKVLRREHEQVALGDDDRVIIVRSEGTALYADGPAVLFVHVESSSEASDNRLYRTVVGEFCGEGSIV